MSRQPKRLRTDVWQFVDYPLTLRQVLLNKPAWLQIW
jgi:hypothetical protein